MLRFVLAACLAFVAADALAVTLKFNCQFGVADQWKPTYPNPGLLANAVTVFPDNAKTTASDKFWVGAGQNNCTYRVSCQELPNGMYRWHASISDERGFCVCQGAIDNTVSGTAPSTGGPVNQTPSTNSIFGTAGGTFTVGP